jgi:glycerol-3-phosphate dehydrogenase
MYDVIIIGAGVSGCSIARFLSRYQARVCVVDKEEDVCCGTSKANSAIIHAGFDAVKGSLMAKMNVIGSLMFPGLAQELDFEYSQIGSLVVCLSEADRPRLQALYENGVKNGVQRLQILDGDRLRAMEPNLNPAAVAALWAPTGGIVCPFGLTIAMAENAFSNGTEFRFHTEVKAVTKGEKGWIIQTNRGVLDTKVVVNASGVYADVFHNMVSQKKLSITPRRGDYCLLDRAVGGYVKHTVFQLPGALGKGVLVSPTVHGNIIVGPTAVDMEDRESVNTTAAGLESVVNTALSTLPGLPVRQVITSFAGVRAHEAGHEFVIGEVPDAPGFIDCAGIESPGLSASPAIGVAVADYIRDKLTLSPNPTYCGTRKGILNPKKLSPEAHNALIKENPAYGRIVCRCESVSEGEIVDAISRPLGARSLDGVKRRTRAGMGRCQAGFCSPKVMEILARELKVDQSQITKCGGESRLVVGTAKDRM